MKITLLRDDFLKKLNLASSVSTGRISIYDNITLIADTDLTLYATDGKVGLWAKVGGKVDEVGTISINGHHLKDIISTYPAKKSVTLTATNNLLVECEGFTNTLFIAQPNQIPTVKFENPLQINLVEKLAKVSWANYIEFGLDQIVGIDDLTQRKQLGVVYHSGLIGHCAVPKEFALIVGRLEKSPCEVVLNDQEILVRQNDYIIKSVLAKPTELDFSGIIPTSLNNWIETPIIQALVNAGKYNPEVIVEFEEGVVNIRSSNDKVGGADITITGSGQGSGKFRCYVGQLVAGLSRGPEKVGLSSGIITLMQPDYTELIATL